MLETDLQTDGDARAPTRAELRAKNLRRVAARRGALLAPSSAARRKTPLAFAEWLVAIARTADLSRPFRREPRQIGLFGEGLAAQ